MSIPVWQDIIERKQEIASREWVMANAPEYILRNLERGANEPWVVGADGMFFRDTRLPHLGTVDGTATILSTAVLAHSASFTTLPAGYWNVNKKLKLTIWGAWTTAATPGNWTWQIRYGTTSAGGTLLATGATVAAAANKTSISAKIEAVITCRAIGASGSIFVMGKVEWDNVSVILPAANLPYFLPAAVPAAVSIDTTSTVAGFHGINIQALRSGSTAETFITHDLSFEALN